MGDLPNEDNSSPLAILVSHIFCMCWLEYNCDLNARGILIVTQPSNNPLEWTGNHKLFAPPPHAPCLPLRGSVQSNSTTSIATTL